MNSRERVIAALNHKEVDRVPIDLGATGQTGISASALYQLRKYLNLEDRDIVISETLQMLAEVEKDLRDNLKVDVIGLNTPIDLFGNKITGEYQNFKMCDSTSVKLPASMVYETDINNNVFVYPQGNKNAQFSGKMPYSGYFFDNIERSTGFDEDNLTPLEDFKDSFNLISDDCLEYLKRQSDFLNAETEYAIVGNLGGAGFGDSAIVPGPAELNPKGIRGFEDWLMAHLMYPEYIKKVFQLQMENMLKNLELYRQAVGDNIQSIFISGTDFGTQNAGFFSKDVFKELYKPYYRQVNDWVHKNTNWKTHFHSCGSIVNYLDDFVEMGVDIINPVQLSAKGMDGKFLKEKYGDKLVFWGAGVDTQKTLPYGTTEEVQREARERIDIFNKDGGFVFAAIHNILANTPPQNIVAAFREAGV